MRAVRAGFGHHVDKPAKRTAVLRPETVVDDPELADGFLRRDGALRAGNVLMSSAPSTVTSLLRSRMPPSETPLLRA